MCIRDREPSRTAVPRYAASCRGGKPGRYWIPDPRTDKNAPVRRIRFEDTPGNMCDGSSAVARTRHRSDPVPVRPSNEDGCPPSTHSLWTTVWRKGRHARLRHGSRRFPNIRSLEVAAQDDSIAQVWDRAVGQLATDPATTSQQLAFIRLARPVGLLDGTMLLSVDNTFTKDYLETRVRNELLTVPVSYTHLRAHETVLDLVCRL